MAAAQQKTDSVRVYHLKPVVITATNMEALRNTVPNAVSIVSRQDIMQSGETSVLPVINRLVPGVFITERGVLGYGASTGAAGNISIRGTGGSPNAEVLVLTDGRPQMMGLMGHPLPDTYVSSGVDRVEIIRGPASLLHGTNAMGGVINIITQQHMPEAFSANAGLSYGTFNTRKFEGVFGYGFEDGGIAVSGSHYGTDGHRAHSDFRITNGSLRGMTSLDGHFTVRADASLSGFKTFDPGPEAAPVKDHRVDIVRGSSGFAIENRHGNLQGAAKVFFNFGRHDIYDGFHSTDNNLGFLLHQGLALLPDNVITVGVDYKRYGGQASNAKTGLDFGEYFVDETGAYMLVQQKLFELLSASAGLRLNHHSLHGNELVPQFGLAARVAQNTTLRACAGKGFRSPTIRELYLFPAPTPTLEPERLWNYELGLLHNFNESSSLDMAGFVSEGSNIIRVGGAFPNLKLTNSGSFVHRGVEVSINTSLSGDFRLDVTYGYLSAGDQTMGNPRHKLYVGGGYVTGLIRTTLGLQHVSGLYGDDFSRKPLSDYTLLNARVTLQLNDRISCYIAGENLFDARYQIMAGYPMPGATALAGINWTAQ
jgi:iron complex outermembrane receptor protein